MTMTRESIKRGDIVQYYPFHIHGPQIRGIVMAVGDQPEEIERDKVVMVHWLNGSNPKVSKWYRLRDLIKLENA